MRVRVLERGVASARRSLVWMALPCLLSSKRSVHDPHARATADERSRRTWWRVRKEMEGMKEVAGGGRWWKVVEGDGK